MIAVDDIADGEDLQASIWRCWCRAKAQHEGATLDANGNIIPRFAGSGRPATDYPVTAWSAVVVDGSGNASIADPEGHTIGRTDFKDITADIRPSEIMEAGRKPVEPPVRAADRTEVSKTVREHLNDANTRKGRGLVLSDAPTRRSKSERDPD